MKKMSLDSATTSAATGHFKLRDLLRLALHTVPYLKATWPEVRKILLPLGAVVLLVLLLVPIWPMLTDLFINCLMTARPLSIAEAKLLRLDPAKFVHVQALSVPAREALRMRLLVATGGLVTVALTIGLLAYNWLLRVLQRIEQSLRLQMVSRIQAMSLRFHSGARVGDSIFRTYQDTAMITNLMWMLVEPVIRLVGFGMVCMIALVLDPRLLAGLLVAALGIWAITAALTPYLRRNFRDARERNSALTSHIQETMAGIKVIKAYGAEPAFARSFEEQSRASFDSSYKARVASVGLGIAVFTFSTALLFAAVMYLALAASQGRPIANGRALAYAGFSVWSLAAYVYATTQLRFGVERSNRLTWLWSNAQDMAIGMGRAFEHADMKPEVSDAPDARPLPAFRDAISLEGVSFAYQVDRPVIRGVDLTARAGTITAIVGPTGSGKSTLASLLLRLFDPDAGAVRIDGEDIRRFTIASLRANVSIALQENLLFGTTIRENIRFAVPAASDAQVREAARIACAEQFIEVLPEGYDTLLGERGTKLSTGQRQRLSIARAIIKDAPILILDEPTASLDADTELRVLQNLATWGTGRAIFLITHRLSTIRRADQIVYLRDGAVIESGSHEALLVRPGGAYRRFVELESDPESAVAGDRARAS